MFLTEKVLTGFDSKWNERKTANLMLSSVYEHVDPDKAKRLRDCAQWLKFKCFEDGVRKLELADFCRVRLCPICSWRRSLRVFSQMCSIFENLARFSPYKRLRYLFLTLTIKNVSGANLSANIDNLNRGWRNFVKYREFSKSVVGWYRGLEVTHNLSLGSDSYDTYHPHFHCFLVVDESYFSHHYLDHSDWVRLWKRAMKLDYDPQVDIRCFRGDILKSFREVTKYSVKSQDYLVPNDLDLSVSTVRVLDKALDKRRFVAFGGLLKRVHSCLRLEREEDANLIYIGSQMPSDELYSVVRYFFSTGYNQYIRQD